MSVGQVGGSAEPANPSDRSRKETPEVEILTALSRVRQHAQEFARSPIRRKVAWLDECRSRLFELAPKMVETAARHKGLEPGSAEEGEEWLGGPVVTLRNMRLLSQALEETAAHGAPVVEARRIKTRRDGRVTVEVTPTDSFDGTLLPGTVCDVWLDASVKRDAIADAQARFYEQPEPSGRVALVLGAGNVAAIVAMDVLYKMFVDGCACVLKMNPVNAYLGPFLEQAFQPLVERGFLAIVYGGASVGQLLCQHPDVDEVHITGSDKTHDLIVWGEPGPERQRRQAQNDPLLKKPISSELGNVSPVLIVPGPYSEDELSSMATNIAGAMVNNASFNCNAAKLIILPRKWPLRQAFLDALFSVLSREPRRPAYYPGAEQRYRELTEGRDHVLTFGVKHAGKGDEGTLPWAIALDLDPADPNEKNFRIEPFCSVTSQVELGSNDPVEFLAEAVPFLNERVWGTLSAMLFVHPRAQSDKALSEALDGALDGLRYGAIGVNIWPGVTFGLGAPAWGAYPGSALSDIQSGSGFVHNTFMFNEPQKSVLFAPLKPRIKLPYFAGHRSRLSLARRLAAFEAGPSWLKVPGLALSALRA